MYYAPQKPICALAQQHFAFLLDNGFVAEKATHMVGLDVLRYRREQWRVEVSLEYRDVWYDVGLVPLVDGKPRQVPFGWRTKYGLLEYLTKYLGVKEEDVTDPQELRRQVFSSTEMVSVEYADEVLKTYARLLAQYLAQIVASPHPPAGRD